jgi:hypothetical protein
MIPAAIIGYGALCAGLGYLACHRQHVHLRESHRSWEDQANTRDAAAQRLARHLAYIIDHPRVAYRAHYRALRRAAQVDRRAAA